MYESKTHSPITRARFTRRMLLHVSLALGLLGVSLGIGMFGYCWFEDLSVLDAFLNSTITAASVRPVVSEIFPPSVAGRINCKSACLGSDTGSVKPVCSAWAEPKPA